MFGFSAYSEAPISQGDPSIDASTFVANTLAQTYSADIAYDAQAVFTLGDLAATLTLEDPIVGISATLYIDSTNGITYLGDVVSVADANQALYSLLNNVAINAVTYTADSNTTIGSIGATTLVNAVNSIADANITPDSTTATLYNGDIAEIRVEVNVFIDSINLDLEKTKPSYILDNFDYAALKEQYDRTRTIYLVGYNTNKTAHVTPQNHTVYVTPENESTVVHINSENYTVTLPKQNGSNTVYIAA